jgi:hypothetical protein
MLRMARDEKRSCDIVKRSQFRIGCIAEKLRSAFAVPTESIAAGLTSSTVDKNEVSICVEGDLKILVHLCSGIETFQLQ